ncbi:hypothetical protein [Geomicrobium sp. JCM 19038]|uniref:hypothetical protein n=1 Tax=Geomicrobium sp. JCM 19038 TaxID=1460635 RepID=UPI00045F1CBA|nr:hypothetical protein [Geomicrobium sp. JCM 19038]GAK08980.1 hypothetical protein JCM19038_2787 [Geomicrobium sp. JCM 19038]
MNKTLSRIKDLNRSYEQDLEGLEDDPEGILDVSILCQIADSIPYLIDQAEKAERYESIIGSIANIDAAFIGTDKEETYTDSDAMKLIEELVKPGWEEVCRTK